MKELKKDMNFNEALKLMKRGTGVKRPNWKGYWAWEENTIMVYAGDFTRCPLLATDYPEQTFDNLAAEDFEEVIWLHNPIRNAWFHVHEISDELNALPPTMAKEKKQGYENLRLLLSGTPMKAQDEESYWTYTEKKHLTGHYRIGDDFDELAYSDRYPHAFYNYIPATTETCAALASSEAGEKVLNLNSGEREAIAMHAFVAAYMINAKSSMPAKRKEIEDLVHIVLSAEGKTHEHDIQPYLKMLNLWRTGCRDV